MSIRTSSGLRAALVAVAAIGWYTGANAQGTLASTSIENQATVAYTVNGVAQTPIESSPTGNTTPGGGALTTFLVDNRVIFTVSEVSTSATLTSPGAVDAVLEYRVTNAGNAAEGYRLTLSEDVGGSLFGQTDNANIGLPNLLIHVDDGDGILDAGDTATAIDSLPINGSVLVFVVATTVPVTLVNNDFANIRLQAQAAVVGTGGVTLKAQTPGANQANVVEVVFADDPAGADGTESELDQFAIRSAALTITKTPTVLSDGFSAAADAKAIPGAVVEYVITIQNTSATTAADLVSITDPVPANTTFVTGAYGAGDDVGLTNGVIASCRADNLDANADGCALTGGVLSVSPAVIGSVSTGEVVTVAFRVTIN
jgi:uncharacterized repeat protein (TIGR01451 family)